MRGDAVVVSYEAQLRNSSRQEQSAHRCHNVSPPTRLGLLVVAAREGEVLRGGVPCADRYRGNVGIVDDAPGVGDRERLGMQRDASRRRDAEDALVTALPGVLRDHKSAGRGADARAIGGGAGRAGERAPDRRGARDRGEAASAPKRAASATTSYIAAHGQTHTAFRDLAWPRFGAKTPPLVSRGRFGPGAFRTAHLPTRSLMRAPSTCFSSPSISPRGPAGRGPNGPPGARPLAPGRTQRSLLRC